MRACCWILLLISIAGATSYQMQYCSNTPGSYFYSNDLFYGYVFTPPTNSLYISNIWLYSFSYVHPYVSAASIIIRLYRVEAEVPTTMLANKTYTPGDYPPQWNVYDYNVQWNGGSDTEFCIAVQPRDVAGGSGGQFHSTVACYQDEALTYPSRCWYLSGGVWNPWAASGDMMVKVDYQLTGVEPSTLGSIKSLFH